MKRLTIAVKLVPKYIMRPDIQPPLTQSKSNRQRYCRLAQAQAFPFQVLGLVLAVHIDKTIRLFTLTRYNTVCCTRSAPLSTPDSCVQPSNIHKHNLRVIGNQKGVNVHKMSNLWRRLQTIIRRLFIIRHETFIWRARAIEPLRRASGWCTIGLNCQWVA